MMRCRPAFAYIPSDLPKASRFGQAQCFESERVAIAFTELGGSPIVRLVITQIFCVPREALPRRGATVEIRPAF